MSLVVTWWATTSSNHGGVTIRLEAAMRTVAHDTSTAFPTLLVNFSHAGMRNIYPGVDKSVFCKKKWHEGCCWWPIKLFSLIASSLFMKLSKMLPISYFLKERRSPLLNSPLQSNFCHEKGCSSWNAITLDHCAFMGVKVCCPFPC